MKRKWHRTRRGEGGGDGGEVWPSGVETGEGW